MVPPACRLTLPAFNASTEKDIAAGKLVILDVDEMPRTGWMLTMSAFHQPSQPPGPAGRWFIDELKRLWPQE